MHKPLRTLVSAAVIGVLSTGAAYAGGFSLYTEGSTVAVGNYAAGVAAEATDASIGWYNPAGLVLIREQQAVFSGIGVFPSSKLSSGTSTYTFRGLPDYRQSFSDLNGAENAFVPAMHYALPLGENATFGFSVTSPFGLSTDWGPESPVRYQATFTELLTSDFSPELGGRLTENFSIGAGLDLQYARVKFNRELGAPNIYGFIIPPFNPSGVDSLTYNKGSSFGVGFHAGLMGMFNDNHTRLGLNYQSQMNHKFHGFSRLSGPLAGGGNIFVPSSQNNTAVAYSNDLTSNSISLPDILTLSGYQDVNEKLALLGSVVYTGWSSLQTIQLNGVMAPNVNAGTGAISQIQINSTSPQNYRDAWRFALGANYKVSPVWLLRVGGGYDQTPTNNVDRDVRLPDVNRWALSIGTHYQVKPSIGIDLGYTHLFAADDVLINRTDPLGTTSTYNVSAVGSANANLVGAQLVWTIDKEIEAPTK